MAHDITLPALLQLTRQVFAGDVKRAELAKRKFGVEVVFVGVAILMAAPDNFLEGHYFIKGGYNATLEQLLSAGVVNPFNHEVGYKTGQDLVGSSRTLKLHHSVLVEGSKSKRRVQLTPPTELVALVEELGCTAHVRAFLRDATEGVARHSKWVADYKKKLGLGS